MYPQSYGLLPPPIKITVNFITAAARENCDIGTCDAGAKKSKTDRMAPEAREEEMRNQDLGIESTRHPNGIR